MVTSRNNFDLIRFILALVVFLYHAHVLSGRPELSVFSTWLSADLAVKGFFVVSGFLVVMSYERATSLSDFVWKRVRRIYPAYAVVIVLTACAGVAITVLPARDYFSQAWLTYVVANLGFLNFLQPELPGIFQQNPWRVVNGALWSLKIEVMFYAAVPAIVWASGRGARWSLLGAMYAASVGWAVAMEALAKQTGRGLFVQLGLQLPGQLRFFLVGAACFYAAGRLVPHWRWLVPVSLGVLVARIPGAVNTVVEPVALGLFVVGLATGVPYLGNFGRRGDLSYGTYITHFPIVQVLVALGLFDAYPWLTLAGASVLVIIAAFVSWHLVEKPFLRSSSHYVATGRPLV